MSENPLVQKTNSDLSEGDLQKIREFKAEGLPGLAKLGESDFHRMTEMYMNGMTYWQIATTLGLKRTLVMYLSHTYGWYPTRQEYLNELQEKIKGRVIDSQLVSQDFLMLLIKVYEKKLGAKFRRYLATDDTSHADDINLKEIDKLLKAIAMIKELNGDSKKSAGKTPAVTLNLGDGATVQRDGDDKFTITPSIDKHLDDIIKRMADGGGIQSGLEMTEALNGLGCPVDTVTLFAASMGWQIAQSLGERLILKNGVMMSHHATGEAQGEFGGSIRTQMENRQQLWIDRVRELDEQTVRRTN
ncbi:unnamed protein product, partial [Sphagnum balticum]